VAFQPPKSNSQGYTLLEMLAVVGMAGIIMGFAVPSFLSLNKPLRSGTLQFKSHLSLIRSKAISSNQAYRIRPKFPVTAQYIGQKYNQTPHNFIVEYAANCAVNTYGSKGATGTQDGWQIASQLDLDLQEEVGVAALPLPKVSNAEVADNSRTFTPADGTVANVVTYDLHLNWEICYDNRGLAYKPVELTLQDFQGNNNAQTVLITVGRVGDIDIVGKDRANNTLTADSQGNIPY
jgi:prepilin-type N-terminal cleavage/methylation domain-containing protein